MPIERPMQTPRANVTCRATWKYTVPMRRTDVKSNVKHTCHARVMYTRRIQMPPTKTDPIQMLHAMSQTSSIYTRRLQISHTNIEREYHRRCPIKHVTCKRHTQLTNTMFHASVAYKRHMQMSHASVTHKCPTQTSGTHVTYTCR